MASLLIPAALLLGTIAALIGTAYALRPRHAPHLSASVIGRVRCGCGGHVIHDPLCPVAGGER